jgi:hypothetical protein
VIETRPTIPTTTSASELAHWLELAHARGATRLEHWETTRKTSKLLRVWDLTEADLEALACELQASSDRQELYGQALVGFGVRVYRGEDSEPIAQAHVRGSSLKAPDARAPGRDETMTLPSLVRLCEKLLDQQQRIHASYVERLDALSERHLARYEGRDVRLQARVDELEQRNRSLLETERNLMLDKSTHDEERAERTHQRAQEQKILDLEHEQKRQRTAFLKEKIELLLPVLAGKVLGAQSPAQPLFQEEALMQFLSSLTPDQQSGLTQLLRPEQAIAFFQLFESYARRDLEKRGLNYEQELAKGAAAIAEERAAEAAAKLPGSEPPKGPEGHER